MQFKRGQLVRRISAPDSHVLGVGSVCRIYKVTLTSLWLTVLKPLPGKLGDETWSIGRRVIYPKHDFIPATKRLKRKQNAI